MATNKVEAAVLKALGKKFKPQQKKEDRKAFLTRVAKALSDLDEDAYKELPSTVQDWYDACLAANKKKKPLPDFGATAAAKPAKKAVAATADDEDEDEESEDDEDEDEEESEEDDEAEEDADEEESEEEDADEEESEDDEDEEEDEEETAEADDEDEDEEEADEEDDADEEDESEDDEDEEESEDDEAEEDDEDEEEEEEAVAELKLSDLAVGDQVKIKTDSGSKVVGKVVKALPKAASIKTRDGIVIKVKQSEVDSVEKTAGAAKAAPEKAAKADKPAKSDEKAPRLSGTGPDLRNLILKHYKVREYKEIAVLADKAKIQYNPSTLKLMHSEAHKWIDLYLEKQKAKAAAK